VVSGNTDFGIVGIFSLVFRYFRYFEYRCRYQYRYFKILWCRYRYSIIDLAL